MIFLNKYKFHIVFIIFLILSGVGINFHRSQSTDKEIIEQQMEGEISEFVEQASPIREIELISEQDDQNAYKLLSTTHQVETEDYGELGIFIKSINSLSGDDKHYWAFYVNDVYAQKSADQTILKQGDKVKFVYEEIDSANFQEQP